jgi:predicted enzyme related to lactoylglutathione lyase
MGRVTGLGGVFFQADDPTRPSSWYETHLGLKGEDGSVFFRWRERDADAAGMTVWSVFPRDSTYFDPSRAPFMLNYRVDDLDSLLERLRAEGVAIDDRREDSQYGRFAWVMDPEGNRVE